MYTNHTINVNKQGAWLERIHTQWKMPSEQPTVIDAEDLHEEDAYAAVFLNVILIICVLLAYFIKEYKVYCLPERYVRNIYSYLSD
jgi:hypothetical protein